MFKYSLQRSKGLVWSSANSIALRAYSVHATPQPFNWEDPLGSQNLLTEEEIAIQETAEAYCQERMLPRVLGKQLAQDSHATVV